MEQQLLQSFIEFGLAGLIGFAIGLERAMAGSENPHAGTRDFIMFALLGAVSAYLVPGRKPPIFKNTYQRRHS